MPSTIQQPSIQIVKQGPMNNHRPLDSTLQLICGNIFYYSTLPGSAIL